MTKRPRLVMIFAKLILFSFISMESFSVNLVFAQASTVSGKIEKIEPLGTERFELSVKTSSGVSKFIIDHSTLVQAEIHAKQVKMGQRIVVSSTREASGQRSVFGNMPERTRKLLGLPDIPEIPEIPKIPKIPKIPRRPDRLESPSELTNLPAAKVAPRKAKGETPQNGAVAPNMMQQKIPAPGVTPSSGGAGAPSPKEKAPQKEAESTIPEEPPKDPGFAKLNPSALTAATQPISQEPVKKVVELTTSEKGITVKLEGETGEKGEEVVLSPDEKVFRVLNVEDLQENMNVHLELSKDSKENFVQRITVS